MCRNGPCWVTLIAGTRTRRPERTVPSRYYESLPIEHDGLMRDCGYGYVLALGATDCCSLEPVNLIHCHLQESQFPSISG